jgi:hypothetical protein
MTVQVDEVQMVPDGFGFHLKASEYTWITVGSRPKLRRRQPTAMSQKPSLTQRLLKL